MPITPLLILIAALSNVVVVEPVRSMGSFSLRSAELRESW